MHQARLRHLQLAQCLPGGVSGCANSFLGTLSLGDVAVDKHEAAAWHRITPHFDDATVGSRALEAQFAPGVIEGAAQFGFEVGRVLAALGEIAEIFGVTRPLGEEGVGQVEDRLEIAVPGYKARVGAAPRRSEAEPR